MNFDLNERTIFLVLSGSRSYGTNTEFSDYDYRGICIPPLDTYIGLNPKFEQIVDTDKNKHVWKHYPQNLVQPNSDMQVMELSKFARLAVDCNPSIIEILFTQNLYWVKSHPIASQLLEKKYQFLSRRAQARYAGYAFSMLKKMRRHKAWIDDPPKIPPTRAEFGLPEYKMLPLDQLGAAEALIKKEIEKFTIDQTDLPEHVKIDLGLAMEEILSTVWSQLHLGKFPLSEKKNFVDRLLAGDFYDPITSAYEAIDTWHEKNQDSTNLPTYLGMTSEEYEKFVCDPAYGLLRIFNRNKYKSYDSMEEVLFEHVIRTQGFSDNFIEVLRKERAYRTAKKHWDSYQTWLQERNPARAELEKKYKYDTKFALHLIRLLRMCREILTEGEVYIHRQNKDGDFLKSILKGAWTFEQIEDFAEKEQKELALLAKTSKLPEHPDINKLHELVFQMIMDFNQPLLHSFEPVKPRPVSKNFIDTVKQLGGSPDLIKSMQKEHKSID